MQFSKRTAALSAASIAAVAFAVPTLASPGKPGPNPGSGNHFPSSSSQTFTCKDTMSQPIGTVALTGPYTLWPPNHKLIDELATATNQDQSDMASTTLTLMPQDVLDAVGGDGGTAHNPDIVFPAGPMTTGGKSASVPFQLRAERSGKGDGRTYTIDWTATFNMQSCSSSSSDTDDLLPFVVSVPHDMGNNG